MKIHLPVGLRKALLACLAFVALPSTLGTASGWTVADFGADEGRYGILTIDDVTLVSEDADSFLLTAAVEGGLYWAGTGDGDTLVWGGDNASQTWSTEQAGTGGNQAWQDETDANFVAASGARNVQLGGDVRVGALQVTGDASYAFSSSAAGTPHTLTVGGGITTSDGADLSFTADVQLVVTGDITLGAGSTLTLAGDVTFSGTVSGDENSVSGAGSFLLFNGDGGSMTLAELTGKYTGNLLGSGVGMGVSGNLTLTEGGNIGRSFKVKNGKLEVGTDDAQTTFELSVDNATDGVLVVDNGQLVVHGTLSAKDNGRMDIINGGSITADHILKGSGHSSTIAVGNADSVGTLTVTNEAKLFAMKVQHSGSKATIGTNLSIWANVGGYALDVDAGSVEVKQNLYGADGNKAMPAVRVQNGGTLTVGGTALFSALNVDSGGTVEVTGALNGTGDHNTRAGAATVQGGGTLKAGSVCYGSASVTGSGSKIEVTENLGLASTLTVTGGATVTAGRIRHANDSGHAGQVSVGDETTSGTLTLTGAGSGDTLRTHALWVRGNDSNVTVHGQVNIYSTVSGMDGYGMVVGGGTVTVDGTTQITQGLLVSGGTVTLTGGLTATSVTLSGGTVTLNAGLTAESVTLTGGTLTLAGTATVSGSFDMSGGVLVLGGESAALGSSLTLNLSIEGDRDGPKLKAGTAGASGQSITLNIDAGDIDVSKFTGGRYHLWEGDVAGGVTVNFDAITIGRGQLSYDSASGDLVLANAERQDLTWTANATALVWQSGDAGTDQWTNAGQTESEYKKFYDGDNVTFVYGGSGNTSVTLGSDVSAWDMTVTGGEWSFDTTDHTLSVSGMLTVNSGAKVTFTGSGSLDVAAATLEGESELVLDGTGNKTFGRAELKSGATVTIVDTDATHYTGTTFFSGADVTDAQVVLDTGSEVSVSDDSNLFAALFAGGDATVHRDAEHVGVSQVVLKSGTTLHVSGSGGSGVGGSLTLARRIVVEAGAVLQASGSSYDGPFNHSFSAGDVSTIVLNGNGTGQGALIFDTSIEYCSWNIELGSDATISSTAAYFNFAGAGKFKANGHVLTLANGGGTDFYLDGDYGAEGSGVIKLAEHGLVFKNAKGSEFGGYVIRSEGQNITIQDTEELHLAALSGEGHVLSNDASRRTLFLDGNAPQDADGSYQYYDATKGYEFTGTFRDEEQTKGFITLNKTGTAIQTVTGDAILQALSVTGGEMHISGKLGVADSGYAAAVNVSGGASLTVGYLRGQTDGHAGCVTVGADDSAGTLEVGTAGQSWTFPGSEDGSDTFIFKAKSLYVKHADSVVNIHGDVNVYSVVEQSGDHMQYEIVINGGTVNIDGKLDGKKNQDQNENHNVSLENGGKLSIGGSLLTNSVELSGDGSTLTLKDAQAATESTVTSLNVGAGSTVVLGAMQSLTVTGTLTMGAGVGLTLKDGTLAADTLDASAGGASLTLTMTSDGNNLDISHLTLGGGGKLSITLQGYDAWAAAHSEGGIYQLFDAVHFGALWGELSANGGDWTNFFEFVVDGQDDLKFTLDASGALIFGDVQSFTWTAEAAAATFTWDAESGASGTPWTTGSGATSADSPVTMDNTAIAGGAVVTLSGDVKAGSLLLKGGHDFTLQAAEDGGSLTLAEGLTLNGNMTLVCNTTVSVGGSLSGSSGSNNNSSILIGDGTSGKLTVTGDVTLGGQITVAQGTFSAANVTATSMTLSGGEAHITGKLGVADSGYAAAVNVSGGASLTVGYLRGQKDGHAGCVTVGADDSAGTLEVGTAGQSWTFPGSEDGSDTFIFKAKSLYVKNAESVVNIHGDVNVYSVVEQSGDHTQYEIVINGGTVNIDGKLDGKKNQDGNENHNVSLENGGKLSIGGSLLTNNVELSGQGSTLTLRDAQAATESTVTSLNVGAGSTVELGAKQSLTVTGTLTMGAGVGLTMKDGTLAADTLDASAGGASLTLTMTEAGENLDITHLTLGTDGKLKITLKGYEDWVGTHAGGEYQLFDTESFGALWSELNQTEIDKTPDDFFDFVIDGEVGIGWTLSETGMLTFTEAEGFAWDTEAGGGTAFTWNAAADDSNNQWTTGKSGTATTDADAVTFTNGQTGQAIVTVVGDVIAASVVIEGAGGGFSFVGGDGSGSIAVAGSMSVQTNTEIGVGLKVGDTVDIANGITLKLNDSLAKAGESAVQITGSGTLELTGAEDKHFADFQTEGTIKVKAHMGGTDTCAYMENVNIAGTLEVDGNELIFTGSNTVEQFGIADGKNLSKLNFDASNGKSVLKSDKAVTVGLLSVQGGTVDLQMDLTVENGLVNDAQENTTQSLKVQKLTITNATEAGANLAPNGGAYNGGLEVTGDFIKTGAGKQALAGGSGDTAKLTFGGSVSIADGEVEFGSGNGADMSITGTLRVENTAGVFAWASTSKNLTVTGATTLNGTLALAGGTNVFTGAVTTNDGTLRVNGGMLTLTDGISGTLTELSLGAGAKLSVASGNITLTTRLSWGDGSVLEFSSSGQQIALGGTATWSSVLDAVLSDNSDKKLTIVLGDAFFGNAESDTLTLLTGTGIDDFTKYFDVSLAENSGLTETHSNLRLTADGKLTWGAGGNDLYWDSGAEGAGDLTWGEGQADEFDSGEQGSEDKQTWQDGANVHFGSADSSDHAVSLADDIATGNFDATGTGTAGRAKFSFASKDGTGQTLTIGGDMSVTNADLTFGDDVNLSVEGDVSLEDSTLSVGGEARVEGALSGEGRLKADGGKVTLAGDVAGFTGVLDTGESGTITLDGTEGEVGASAAGNGTLEVNSEKGVTLTGALGGEDSTLTVKNSGKGTLEITSETPGNGIALSFGEGEPGDIVLGDVGHNIRVDSTKVEGAGRIVLRHATLASGFEKGGASVVVDTAISAAARTVSAEGATGGVVDVGGLEAGKLDGITVNAHGQLTNVAGKYTVSTSKKLTLHFTAENSSASAGDVAAKALIVGATDGVNIELGAGDAAEHGLQLGMDLDVMTWFRTHDELYLRVLGSGTWKTDGVSIDWTKMTDTTAQILNLVVGQNYQFTSDGLKLTGSTKDMYLVTGEEYGDSPNSSNPTDFSGKLATVVTNEQTLTLKWAEDGTVNNLLGTEGTQLVIRDVGGKGITVTLDNTYHDPLRDDRYPENTEAKGQDTTFEGSITGGDGVDIVKSGLGKLTVGGNYTLDDGDTRIEAGALELGGEVNEMGSLTFAYGAAPGEGEQRGVFLDGGQTVIGRIEEAADAASTDGNEVNIVNGAGLTLTGQSTLAHTGITGDGSGTLKLADGAGLTFTGTEGIKGVAVNLEGERSTLDLGATQSELTSLTGKGTLKSAAGGNVSVGGGIFSGTLDGTGGGTLTVADNASVTLDNVKGTGMNVRLQGKGSTLTIDVSKKTGSSDDTLVLGSIDFGGGHLTLDYGDKGIGRNYVQATITGDGTLEFRSDGPVANGDVRTGLTVNGDLPDFKFSGVGSFLKDYTPNVDTESKELVFTMTDAVENKFEREIPGAGKNAHAGARMLWESLRDLTPGDALFALLANPTSDYARLVFTLVQDIDNGQTTGLERTLTSVAGASISTLTPALAQDIHRQLTTIRNRTTGMLADVPTDGCDEFPFWHAWIQAEGGYHKMDADGTAPGFTLHNWGGTVGVDADISRATTMGLAVTAMYGDLKPDAADSATGDLDTVYLSAFARTMRGAWSHTFVLSGGIAEAKLDRTVSYNGGSYRTRGDTDGYVVGALYEVGYTRLANKEGTVALQPIANVELRHTSLRGYTEKGSDAGVDVDDMDMTVLTLGAGARVQAAVGENAFNRSTVLEARLLAKADIGDRSGTATNAIIGHSKRVEVESAEVGAVGIETGVGISIPLGSHSGSIFADASLEWRDNWVSTNATLGYRINF